MNPELPLVTVVVVTVDNVNILKNCLASICLQDYKALEIVVVDNGSSEHIRRRLTAEFPEVHMIRLDKNYGFAQGNNRGIEIARGEYVALINNDAVAAPQWISSLVKTAETDSMIGAVASIVIDGNQPGVLDSCGVGIGFDGMSRQDMRGMPVTELAKPREVLLFSGCACLLKMEALREVGLFDEDFFAYCEDTDLGLRLRRAGWKTMVGPEAYVYHYYSLTGGKFSLQKVYWVERNHFWVAIKNFPWFLLVMIPVITLFRYFAQAYCLLKDIGELNRFTEDNNVAAMIFTCLKAYVDMLAKVPSMLAKRRAFIKRDRLGSLGMFHLIRKFHLSVGEIIGMGKRRPVS
jgi:GT2 family glycosyltransferase